MCTQSRLYIPTCVVCVRVDGYSLGQSVLLHGCVSLLLPWHSLPPLCGDGLLHRRTRVTLPAPHVVEHVDHGDQCPQPPSTRPSRDPTHSGGRCTQNLYLSKSINSAMQKCSITKKKKKKIW